MGSTRRFHPNVHISILRLPVSNQIQDTFTFEARDSRRGPVAEGNVVAKSFQAF